MFTNEADSFERLWGSENYALFRYENTGKTHKFYPCKMVAVGPGYLKNRESIAVIKGSHLEEVFSNQIIKLQVGCYCT